mmetsp:Transcript_787/g.1196  ORF Transcript_787/g.1196 Transcript_787/m.1196 type:complete len:294 (+) Transcript_787:977-1858(+)
MVELTVLGIAQDGGRPQAGCLKSCCSTLTPSDVRYPVALGIVDHDGSTHLIEASRHLGEQLRFIWKLPTGGDKKNKGIDHVWITHAHLGHVDGLGLLGREAMNAEGIHLHVSESMANLIRRTPSWNLLADLGVFDIEIFNREERFFQSSTLQIEHVAIPHRAELSDMHGFIIRGLHKSLFFLPDQDSWEDTLSAHDCRSIRHFLQKMRVDIALIDGTFWSFDELADMRDQTQVPHPPVAQTLNFLGSRLPQDPEILFIHLNHTNPLFDLSSAQYQTLQGMGWKVATQGMKFVL